MSRQFEINYDIVRGFERAKGDAKAPVSTRMFTVILMGVFFIVLMIGLIAGVSMYQSVSRMQSQTNETHLQTGLLANTVHVNDAADAALSGNGPEGPALVLTEHVNGSSYETRIYLYKRFVVQEYAIAGREYNPDNARKLVESSLFEFDIAKNGLISITTDAGTFDVALRSSQDGSQSAAQGSATENPQGAAQASVQNGAASTSASGSAIQTSNQEGGAK